MLFFFFGSFFSELGTEPRALCFLGKRSTTKLNPQPLNNALKYVDLISGYSLKQLLLLKVYLFYLYEYINIFIYIFFQTHQKRASDPITDGCEPPCGCWESNSGPLEEQSVLLTAKPALQPQAILFFFLKVLNASVVLMPTAVYIRIINNQMGWCTSLNLAFTRPAFTDLHSEF